MFGKALMATFRRGRKFLEGFLERAQSVIKEKQVDVVRYETVYQSRRVPASKGYILQHLVKYGRQNLATELRHQFSKSPVYREYKGLANKLSMFAFVGIGVASYNNEQQDFTGVCEDIKKYFSASTYDDDPEDPFQNLKDHSLDDYQLGSMIAKGCNAAVYRAKWMAQSKPVSTAEDCHTAQTNDSEDLPSEHPNEHTEDEESDTFSDIEVIEDEYPPGIFVVTDGIDHETFGNIVHMDIDSESDIEVISEEQINYAQPFLLKNLPEQHLANESAVLEQAQQDTEQRSDYDLAIKMIFNYDIESNACELYKQLEKEMLPARSGQVQELLTVWHNGHRAKEKCRLPSHPNIVTLYGGFVDDVPGLPEAFDEYPDALPPRLNPDGCGRNKTLFLVMKRYPFTLKEYLQVKPDLSTWHSTLLLLQLVEAIVHMTDHGVAHRDLKSDNIFVEEIDGCPHLVVSDFGEAKYFEPEENLCVPYVTDETSKGGNEALRAPEIACAKPAPDAVLDYRKSDLWTAGTLAYEIFYQSNPFYRSEYGERLRSTTYSEGELPPVDGAPVKLQKLIRNMLSRDPSQRLHPRQVSTCLHLLLWSPSEWPVSLNNNMSKKSQHIPSEVDLIRWLLLLTAQVLLEQLQFANSVAHTLRNLFLSHVDFTELVETVQFF